MIQGFRDRPSPPTWARDEMSRERCDGCGQRLGVNADLFECEVPVIVLACPRCHHCRFEFDDKWLPITSAVLDALEARLAELFEAERAAALYHRPAAWVGGHYG